MSRGLDRRLTALAEAVQVADGRLEPDAVQAARAIVDKAGARLGLGVENTVVALAGPTGVGKSLLFNALSGAELATVGRRRPTTSEGQAAAWGDGADPLLDWLEIGRRHRLEDGALNGLLLLDLPDFDSVETGHRLEVDRVVELADLVLWVVEPQKYADASLHDRYLRPLQTHGAAMAVVLNQSDLLSRSEIDDWRRDASRLLADDGLPAMPVLVVSARTGEGLDSLRRLLADRVTARDAAVARLAADVTVAARTLGEWCADRKAAGSSRQTASGWSRRSRRRAACRGWFEPSMRRTGTAARSRPAGRSSAGSAGCGRILFGGSASAIALPRGSRSRVGPPCRSRPRFSTHRWRLRPETSPTVLPKGCRHRGRRSPAMLRLRMRTASPTGSSEPSAVRIFA